MRLAKAGHAEVEAAGGQGAVGGGCDWQAAAGGRGQQASANCKVKKQ